MNSSKKFVSLGLAVTINLVLQFLFQWYIIISLGAGVETDALFGTMALPQFILVVLSGSLTIVLIPLIAKYTKNEFLEESWNYFQGVGLLFTVVGLLLLISAEWWVFWILPGFKGVKHQLALNLARIQVVGMIFSALLSVVWAVHSAKNNFFKIEYTSIAANIIAFILVILFIKTLGIYAVAWVNVLRVALQVLFLIKIMGVYRRPNFKSPSFKEAWGKLRPLIAGNAYYKTDVLVDRYLTSKGASGELSLLNLAQQIFVTANSILVKVLVNTMVPEMAIANATGDEKRFNQILRKRLIISFVSTTITLVAMLLIGRGVLSFIFSFKKFTTDDVHKLWWLLVLLTGYLMGGLIGSVTSASFYAKGDTVTPTKIGAVLFTIYIPVKILCYLKFGISGLAISISIYYLISFMVQLFYLRKHLI